MPARRAASRTCSSAPQAIASVLPSGSSSSTRNSGIIETGVLGVRCLAGGPAAEVAGRADRAVALLGEQLDEPRLVLDLLVEDPRRHVIGARVLAEREAADLRPRADRASLGLQQDLEDGRSGRPAAVCGRGLLAVARSRQVGIRAAGAVGEVADVVRDRAAELEDARRDQLEVRAVLQACVFADLLVVLVSGEVHAQ